MGIRPTWFVKLLLWYHGYMLDGARESMHFYEGSIAMRYYSGDVIAKAWNKARINHNERFKTITDLRVELRMRACTDALEKAGRAAHRARNGVEQLP